MNGPHLIFGLPSRFRESGGELHCPKGYMPNGFAQEVLITTEKLLPKNSRAKAQSRKALPRFKGFL
jgi:hypothetical protein